jgi:hypothetical protein
MQLVWGHFLLNHSVLRKSLLLLKGINAHFDKKTVQRLQDIEDLSPAVKEKLFFLIDTILRDTKAQKAYAH